MDKRKCAICDKNKAKRYCIRNNKHICWMCCNEIRIDYKCTKECEYKVDERVKPTIKTDCLSEFNDFLDKHTQAWLRKKSEFFNNQIPMMMKETKDGKEQLTKVFKSLNLDKRMAVLYEKYLEIDLDSKNMKAQISFEDTGAEFFTDICEQNWNKLQKYFQHKPMKTSDMIIQRLRNRVEVLDMVYFLFTASGSSQNLQEAFSSAEINYKYNISILFKNEDGEWKIDNIIFGEINLIYSENDSIKHIAQALSKAEYDRATTLLEKAEEIYYLSPDIQYYWGLYHSLKGDVTNALKYFELASVLDTQYTEAIYNSAFIYHSQNNIEKAKLLYKRVLDINSTYINALNNMGTILLNEKKFDDAKDYFNKCLQYNPEYKNAIENLKKIEELIG